MTAQEVNSSLMKLMYLVLVFISKCNLPCTSGKFIMVRCKGVNSLLSAVFFYTAQGILPRRNTVVLSYKTH
jgi:hypothetical protein